MPQTPTPQPNYYTLTPQSQERIPIALPTERRLLVERSQRLMGTTVSVQIACPTDQHAQANAASDRCMMWFAEVNARLSRFDPASEICALNQSAGRWFAASPMLFAAVEVALAAARDTYGLFDPTLLGRLAALGYDRDFAQIAHREVTGETPPSVAPHIAGGWRGIRLDRARRRIRLPAGVALDLGGIAKGWAADVAFLRYCQGFSGALLNVGGDLRAHGGPQPGEGWTVGVRDPRSDGLSDDGAVGAQSAQGDTPYLAIITMSRGGLATSGAARRCWLRNGQRQHHLLDPRTGEPIPLWTDGAEDTTLQATATALAPTATQAEVAAKVALLRGAEQALTVVDTAWDTQSTKANGTVDAPMALLLVNGAGKLRLSRHMNDYLATWATEGGAIPSLRPWLADEIYAGVDTDISTNIQTKK